MPGNRTLHSIWLIFTPHNLKRIWQISFLKFACCCCCPCRNLWILNETQTQMMEEKNHPYKRLGWNPMLDQQFPLFMRLTLSHPLSEREKAFHTRDTFVVVCLCALLLFLPLYFTLNIVYTQCMNIKSNKMLAIVRTA